MNCKVLLVRANSKTKDPASKRSVTSISIVQVSARTNQGIATFHSLDSDCEEIEVEQATQKCYHLIIAGVHAVQMSLSRCHHGVDDSSHSLVLDQAYQRKLMVRDDERTSS